MSGTVERQLPAVSAKVRALLTADAGHADILRTSTPAQADPEIISLLAVGEATMRRLAAVVVTSELTDDDLVRRLTLRAWALAVTAALTRMRSELPAEVDSSESLGWLRDRYADPLDARRDGLDLLADDVLG